MTIILKNKGSLYGRCVSWDIIKTKKPIKYLKRDLKVIDLRETNANKPFCDITFLDNNKTYTELIDRINIYNRKV